LLVQPANVVRNLESEHICRKSLSGAAPTASMESCMACRTANAAALNNHDRIWGAALRGVAGASQNMYRDALDPRER
jgi:hypothetical protein